MRIFLTVAAAVIILTAIISPDTGCCGDERLSAPWDFNHGAEAEEKDTAPETKPSIGGALLIGAVRFYQNHLSPVIGDRCPMYPSCSAYSIQAIRKHGFFMGWLMTADRLIHENTEMDLAPLIRVKDEFRRYDPVSGNDFWWYKQQ
ncbi:MAG: membrane protein insertion efficiency factor YidD [Deltaproteobacteria bacterium]|nr:membrane protein insertion efficiency factor YidD [Deltaproteobacteria bacterium]